jgi:uncharacterized membrane protein YkoI
MHLIRTVAVALAALPLIVMVAQGQESETRIQRNQLPAAVERTVATQSTGTIIKGFSREVEDGKTFYEVELTVQGRSRDVLMDSDGTVVEVEEQVVLDSLPPAVRTALESKAGQGQITSVESLTKKGQLVAYEAHVKAGSRRTEVQVGPNGETLDHEE